VGDILRDGLNVVEAETRRWMQQRRAELQAARQAAKWGQRVWAVTPRVVAQIVARAPGELRAVTSGFMGTHSPPAPPRRIPPIARTASGRPRPTAPRTRVAPDRLTTIDWGDVAQGARNQATAAIHGEADELSFGLADRGSAFARALVEPGAIQDFGRRYSQHMDQERAQDRYDSEHFHTARLGGQVGGAVASFFIPGGAFVRGGKLLRGAAALAWREKAALAAAAAAAGAGGQVVVDGISGRLSSPKDALGAAVGGAAGVLSLPLTRGNPGRAAAVDASVTSAMQDLLNGRPISVERATRAIIEARALGTAAGAWGQRVSSSRIPADMERLGVQFGRLRSRINGWRLNPGTPKADRLSRSYWKPDAQSGDTLFEYKGGYSAGLSTQQRLAQAERGARFVYYHTTPDDIAHLIGVPTGTIVRGPGRDELGHLSERPWRFELE